MELIEYVNNLETILRRYNGLKLKLVYLRFVFGMDKVG